MCNAWNHTVGCKCGWGGAGSGGWRDGGAGLLTQPSDSFGWCAGFSGTLRSYLNPNAHCPVCGAQVYFYRSPFNGRVFFDTLGPPWDKHPCTDNGAPLRRVERDEIAKRKPAWPSARWQPVLAPKVQPTGDRYRVNGTLNSTAVEIITLHRECVDQGPVLVRPHETLSGFFETTYLRSSKIDTRAQFSIGVDSRLAQLDAEVLSGALAGDAEALASIARYIFYKLDDIEWAKAYFEEALAAGETSVIYDLLVLAIFHCEARPHSGARGIACTSRSKGATKRCDGGDREHR